MKRALAAAALAAAIVAPTQAISAGAATAEQSALQVSSGSAAMPPSCVGKIDPILFYMQSLFGAQPRHCL